VDLASIIPFDVLLLLMDQPSASLQRMKMLRCLRVLRLIKLLRILRTSRIVLRWQNYFAIPFTQQKFMKFVVVLILVAHWMACLWGGIGIFLGKDVCPDPAAGVISFDDVPLDEVSWITTLYTSSKWSPDGPCNSLNIYLAALHWSVMTITSIGYGDIYPVRAIEYVVCIGCMLLGGVLWAYIIGCTCSILSNMHPVQENYETNTDLLNMIMKEVAMPTHRKQQYREFLREAKVHNAMTMFSQVTKSFSPLLRKQLMLHTTEKWIRGVYYFREAPLSLVMELAERLTTRFYARREPLTDIRHCLCLIERGTLAHGGVILVAGGFFQEDMILSNTALQIIRPTVSLTYALILLLSRKDLDEVLRSWPDFERKIRKYAAKLAVCRIVKLCAEYESADAMMEGEGIGQNASLSRAFTALDNCSGKVPTRKTALSSLTTAFCSLDHTAFQDSQRPRRKEDMTIVESAFRAVRGFKMYGQDLPRRNSYLGSDSACGGSPLFPRSSAKEDSSRHEPHPEPRDGMEEPPSSAPHVCRIEQRLEAMAKELMLLSQEVRAQSSFSL